MGFISAIVSMLQSKFTAPPVPPAAAVLRNALALFSSASLWSASSSPPRRNAIESSNFGKGSFPLTRGSNGFCSIDDDAAARCTPADGSAASSPLTDAASDAEVFSSSSLPACSSVSFSMLARCSRRCVLCVFCLHTFPRSRRLHKRLTWLFNDAAHETLVFLESATTAPHSLTHSLARPFAVRPSSLRFSTLHTHSDHCCFPL